MSNDEAKGGQLGAFQSLGKAFKCVVTVSELDTVS